MPDRVLIVEDERITAEDLQETLHELGYQVTGVVSTGADAIRQAETNPPDIALMDIRIRGDLDGTGTARILRERFDIPVVYLTAHADRTTLEHARKARPLGYLAKPYQKAELRANIEIALDAHRGTRITTERYLRLADILSAVVLGIISVNQREIVVMLNSTAEDLTGWKRAEASGRHIGQVVQLVNGASGLPFVLPIEEVLRNGTQTEFSDVLLVSRSGERNPVMGNIAPVRKIAGRPAGAVILLEAVPPPHSDPGLQVTAKAKGPVTRLAFGRFHLISASPAMKEVLAFAGRAARSEVGALLLQGETGTGKDVVAHFIHHSSGRRAGPFIALNCSAIPESLLESELFGYEPGAFTDARSLKRGLFESAAGGTLFLDEVADMSPAMQAKLLRVAEEKSFRRLGGVRDLNADVRVVAATNRDLAAAVREGKFRLDLYHRLSVIEITIPPLRERREAILPLANYFLSLQRRDLTISPEAEYRLMAHQWPGNVRELRNVIERAGVLEDSEVVRPSSIHFTMPTAVPPAHVPPAAPAQPTPDMRLASAERRAVAHALAQTHGNQVAAAKLLGITREVLRHRMKRFAMLPARTLRRHPVK